MKRFVLRQRVDEGTTVRVEGVLYRHMAVVMRVKQGEEVVINDGRGSAYRARVASVDKEAIFLHILELLQSRNGTSHPLILCQGIPKHDRMELVLQKGTELGVTRFIPFTSRHTVPRLSESATGKVERWNRIILEAARQSRQEAVPELSGIITFDALHSELNGITTLLLFEGEETASLRDVISSCDLSGPLALIVGPEGGFAKEEALAAESEGVGIVSLGKRILRTETAGLAAVSIVQYCRGEIG